MKALRSDDVIIRRGKLVRLKGTKSLYVCIPMSYIKKYELKAKDDVTVVVDEIVRIIPPTRHSESQGVESLLRDIANMLKRLHGILRSLH